MVRVLPVAGMRYLPGTSIGGYVIRELIAEGSFAEVYEAENEFTRNLAAVKVLTVKGESAKRRFRVEAILGASLRHRNLVSVTYGAAERDGTVWFAMERLYGRTLKQILAEDGPMSTIEALRYIADAAAGVGALHLAGAVHRDLKPSNIFVTEAGVVKVLDFGMSKLIGLMAPSSGGWTRGTTAYMAPEQIQGETDERSDIYALGHVFYEMVLGRHAFVRRPDDWPSQAEMTAAHLERTPEPLPNLIPGFRPYVWAVISRALAKSPSVRYQAVGDFEKALRFAMQRWTIEVARPRRPFLHTTDYLTVMPRIDGDTPATAPPAVVLSNLGTRRAVALLSAAVGLAALGAIAMSQYSPPPAEASRNIQIGNIPSVQASPEGAPTAAESASSPSMAQKLQTDAQVQTGTISQEAGNDRAQTRPARQRTPTVDSTKSGMIRDPGF